MRLLADRVSNASSPEELLALLEQMVASCFEIIGTILTDQGSGTPQSSPGQNFSNNDIN